MEETIQEKLAKERTILAAERTYAAWIRTGLSGIAGGLAIIKFIPFNNIINQVLSYTAGILLIFWGLYTIYSNYADYKDYLIKMEWENRGRKSGKFKYITFILLLVSFIILIVSMIHISESL